MMRTSLVSAVLSLSILFGDSSTDARKVVKDPYSPFVGQHAGKRIIHHEEEKGATIALERKAINPDSELSKLRNKRKGTAAAARTGRTQQNSRNMFLPDVASMNLEEYLEHNKPISSYLRNLFYGKQEPFPEKRSKKHRLGQSYTIDQTNHWNFEYVGPLYMGSSSEETSVVYDTGSDWLVVGTEKCTNCIVPTYSTGNSNNYNNNGMSRTGQRLYGSTSLEGFEVFDKVCLVNGNACADNFYWFEITSQEGMDEVNGIMGLSTGFTNENGPLFLEAIGNAGGIGANKFGVAFKGLTSQSFIDIGTYKDSSMNDPSELVEMSALDNFWWAQTITGLRFGEGESVSAFSIPPDFCMTDTGTSLVYIPESMFNTFMDKLLETVDDNIYQADGDDILTLCEPSAYPKVSILYASYWAEILPEDYILDVSLAEDRSICMVGFTYQGDDEGWMLGDVFLRGFYATHDMDAKMMGFAPSSGSKKNMLISGSAPDEELESGRSIWFWIFIGLIVVLVVAGIYVFVFSGSFIPNPPGILSSKITQAVAKKRISSKALGQSLTKKTPEVVNQIKIIKL